MRIKRVDKICNEINNTTKRKGNYADILFAEAINYWVTMQVIQVYSPRLGKGKLTESIGQVVKKKYIHRSASSGCSWCHGYPEKNILVQNRDARRAASNR